MTLSAGTNRRLVSELSLRVKGWEELTSDNRDARIVEALDAFEDGREFEIGSRHTHSGHPETLTDELSDIYLSRTEVAERIGVAPSTLSRYSLPEPDALIGKTRGWRVSTIDQWNEQRPGSGRWGR